MITVNAVNDPPVAVNQSVVLNEDESATIYVYGCLLYTSPSPRDS